MYVCMCVCVCVCVWGGGGGVKGWRGPEEKRGLDCNQGAPFRCDLKLRGVPLYIVAL